MKPSTKVVRELRSGRVRRGDGAFSLIALLNPLLAGACLLLCACHPAAEDARLAALEERMERLEERIESVVVEERGEVRRRDHDIEELEDRIALLARRLEGPDQRGESFPLFPDILSMPPISAEVTSVDPEANIVMLSAGRDDGVRVGFEFTVYRGSEYVGKVTVRRVEADWCSGESIRPIEKQPIRVCDKATTRF